MARWLLKALAQKSISLLPRSDFWNGVFQQYVSGTLAGLTPQWFEGKVLQGRRHLENYAAFASHPAASFTASEVGRATGVQPVSRKPPASFTAFEVGTGWYPIVPVVLYLCGASRIWTTDRMRMLRRDRVLETLKRFADCARSGKLATLMPRMQPGRLYVLRSMLDAADAPLVEILRRMNIDYMPGDARHTGLPEGCAHLVFSNLVLGYVRRDLLPGIMAEFRRVVSPGGVMSHLIDMSDLYAVFDKRITPYNFLRYSTPTWRLLNNDVQHLNRLRITDYRELHETAGFSTVHEECTPGSIETLTRVPLAGEFRHYSREDLAVLNAWIVSRPR